jgi:hypothetical protein
MGLSPALEPVGEGLYSRFGNQRCGPVYTPLTMTVNRRLLGSAGKALALRYSTGELGATSGSFQSRPGLKVGSTSLNAS